MMYIFIFLLSVLVSSVSQVLLKSSANKAHDNVMAEYLNLKVVVAYGLFFLSTLITILAYREVPLSLGGILEACGYVFVAILGRVFLKEKIGRRKAMGLIVILIGIVIYNL